MATINNEQEKIKNWFENMYAKRSKLYLRPPEAYEVFMTLIEPKQGMKLLDVACGAGRLLEVAQNYDVKIHGVDISENAIGHAQRKLPNAKLSTGNAENLPYSDGQFDYVTCIGSLERFIELDKALAEQYRVGKSTARYCFMVRNSNTLSWKFMKEGLGMKNTDGHQGAKSLEEWSAAIEKMGFKIERVVADQWPRKRLMRFVSPRMNYKKINSTILPIDYASEFIFLATKA